MAEIVTMPKLGFDMAEGTLVRWVRSEGEKIEKGAVLAEIETDKATVEVESTFSGIVHKFLVEKGSSVPVGTPIAIIAAEGEKVKLEDLNLSTQKAPEQPERESSVTPDAMLTEAPVNQSLVEPTIIHASPLARKMALEAGLDLRKISGSGPDGRIVKRDIEGALSSGSASISAQSKQSSLELRGESLLNKSIWEIAPIRADKKIPIEKLRAAIGRRMVESKQQFPHFYVTHTYDVDRLLELRKEFNEFLDEKEKVSVNDFIIKAAALTLRRFPNLNASVIGDQIVQHGHIHIGIAVSIPGGLLTIVCKDVDQKPLKQISLEVKEMAARARSGKVRPEDIEGSTFSISNLGMYDVEDFVAIINPPEAAILAIGTAKHTPVIKEGNLAVGNIMKATISVDHRVSDGVEAAQFMQALADYLEHPLGFLIF